MSGVDERFGPWRVERTLHQGDWADVIVGAAEPGDGAAAPDDVAAARGARVAVKRLHRHAVREPEALRLFTAEAELATALPPHPRLVQGLRHDVFDERPCLAMRLVDGRDLRAARAAPLPAPRAIAIVRDACAALDHLHAHGWVHGDVGPANLIVDAAGRATLCDLGVARRLGDGGPVRGTAAYMAPEQVRGAAWTAATDVFALGVVLWELVTGARLFLRGASFLSMAAAVEDAAPPLGDDALDAIAQAALVKDPAARTPTATALADALATLAAARGWPLA